MFSVMGLIVNILGFAGPKVSLTTTQLSTALLAIVV
jgi:hypothetical protein